MTRDEALRVLGFAPESPSQDVSNEHISSRYQRLLRRYPREVFPEKFAQITTAYDLLSDPLVAFRDILRGRELNFSMFNIEKRPALLVGLRDRFESWYSHLNYDSEAAPHQRLIMRLFNQWQGEALD